ncbi:ribosome biogenesis GTPase YqeH [Evansella cellulosilytica]|uniref:Ribosome biogenesis GTPase YqeH n=1 Tax=Evansella cellulosilytica (strain ATCC 21833 / DSM 2522 / FERM P-1141 / JCM 9156 / N-4) TaxID=649639 RepID=E6TW07_EVAC2|nr:ribosome biogenesis GTPase YqeH [Evansella cellulosilytica]ADU29830.1 ribosome biogenesis GTPase YqeH [Evansella cellulosilytica DSM 2522]
MKDVGKDKIICSGCGISIQTEEPNNLGYAPKSALTREVIICQRCFKLKHYNEVQDVPLTDDDFLKILNELGKKNALIVKVVDIFDFDGSWLQGLPRFVGNNPILLVGNKVDLLPKSVKRNKLVNWMKWASKNYGLKPADIHLMSAETGEGVMETASLIDKWREGRDVYVVGSTNVGKSTFINRLLKEFGADDEFLITTSNIPGTTLDMIDIPLDDGASLFDTPGIINHHQMAHRLNKNELKVISPRKEVKPTVFQLNDQQTLFFGGLARLDFLQGEGRSFVCYFSNELNIHRTKLEKADQLFENHLGELLTPPFKENVDSFPELVKKEWKLTEEKQDIVISGLGWVTVHGKGAQIRTFAPKGVHVSIRPSIF